MSALAPQTKRNTARQRFDHDAALQHFIALGPMRTFSDVASKFKVSVTAVCKVAKAGNWNERAAEVDRSAAEKALARVQRSRDQRVAQTLRIVDGALLHAETNLETLAADQRLSDLPHLVKLAELLEGEATGRVEIGDVQVIITAVFTVASRFVPADQREAFMGEIDQAVGGLTALGQGEAEAA